MRAAIAAVALGLATTILGLPTGVLAKEVVDLDFEELAVADTENNHDVGPVYTASGLTLTTTHPVPGNVPHLNFAGTAAPVFAGSTMLFSQISQSEIRLTRSDGEHFHLLAIDLAELPGFQPNGDPTNLGPFDITFIGTRKNGKTISFTATVNPFPAVTTVMFWGFTNLVSVHWFQGAGSNPGQSTHQFDDIVVRLPGKPAL